MVKAKFDDVIAATDNRKSSWRAEETILITELVKERKQKFISILCRQGKSGRIP